MTNTNLGGLFLIVFIALFLVPASGFTSCEANLIVLVKKSGEWYEIDDHSPLRSGDQLRILLETAFPCYIAFFWKDSQNQVFNLTPKTANNGNVTKTMPHQVYALPGNERVYTLDDSTGNETLILVTSDSPITNLNALGRFIARHHFVEFSELIPIAGYNLKWKIILHENG